MARGWLARDADADADADAERMVPTALGRRLGNDVVSLFLP